jgi:hypothetical protein
MNSKPQDPSQQPPYVGWQAPQDAWQQPSYGASPQPPQPPRQAGRGLGCAIAAIVAVVVLIMLGGVIWGGVALYQTYKNGSTNTHARSATSSAPKPTLQLQTVAGLNGLLTDIRNRFGDTMGYDLNVNPDSASLTRADPNNNRHTQQYYNNDGNWTSSGGQDSPPGGEAVVDLSKFDVNAVIAKLTSAPQSLGMTDVKDTRLMIRGLADLGPNGFTTTGTLTPQIWVDDIRDGDAYMDLNPDGSVKALHPLS